MKKQSLMILLMLISLNKIATAQITFQKTYDAGGNDVANCVQQTNDGGYVIAGYTTSGISGSGKDVLLMKMDKNGNLIWNKTYGSTGDEQAAWVQQTSDGGYIVCGYKSGINTVAFLIKTNQTGDTLWTKSYYASGSYINYVEQTSDNGYIACGSAATTSSWYGLIIKVDNEGNVLWSMNNNANYNSVHQTSDGGYIAAGTINDGWTEESHLLKLNSAGDTIWTKDYWIDDPGDPTIINSIIQAKDLSYVFAGQILTSTSFGAPWYSTIVKTDQFGNIVWQQKYGDASNATQVRQTNDGAYIATLTSTTPIPGGTFEYNIYALKMDTGGNYEWCKSYKYSDTTILGSIQQTTDGGFIMAGANQGASLDVYLIKTDSNGTSNCNETSILMSAGNPSYGLEHITTSNYAVNTAIGHFAGYIDSLSYTTNTLCDSNTTITTDTTTGIAEIQKNSLFSVFPNPTSGQFTVLLPANNSEIIVTDMLGQEIIKIEATQRTMNLQLEQNGVYIVYVKTQQGTATGKLIVSH